MKIHPSLALLALAAALHAQAPPPVNQVVEEAGADYSRSITVCHETFSVPLAVAAKLHREDKSDAEIYAFLVSGQEKDGIRQESFEVLRAKSSQRATTESICEFIYPSEYEPPSIPGNVGVSMAPPPVKGAPSPVPDTARLQDAPALGSLGSLRVPSFGTAFETRNTGRTLEFEATIGDDPKATTVHLRISPEQVILVGRSAWGQGLAKTEMPTFETQRATTSIVARLDQPLMLGTPSRPPVSKLDPDSSQRVWFAFATVSIFKP